MYSKIQKAVSGGKTKALAEYSLEFVQDSQTLLTLAKTSQIYQKLICRSHLLAKYLIRENITHTPKFKKNETATDYYKKTYNNLLQYLKERQKNNADLNAPLSEGIYAGKTPFNVAVAEGYEVLVHLIIKVNNDKKLDKKILIEHYSSALLLASSRGHIEVVKLLILEGAHVNHQKTYLGERDNILGGHRSYSFGDTPLYQAADNGHTPIVNFLLASGARADIVRVCTVIRMNDKDLQSYPGQLPTQHSLVELDTLRETPILAAVRNNHSECVRVLLKHDPALNVHKPTRYQINVMNYPPHSPDNTHNLEEWSIFHLIRLYKDNYKVGKAYSTEAGVLFGFALFKQFLLINKDKNKKWLLENGNTYIENFLIQNSTATKTKLLNKALHELINDSFLCQFIPDEMTLFIQCKAIQNTRELSTRLIITKMIQTKGLNVIFEEPTQTESGNSTGCRMM